MRSSPVAPGSSARTSRTRSSSAATRSSSSRAGLAVRAAGVDADPRFEPARLGDARRSVLDVSRAASELGWRARTPLADGLRRTWDWLTQD